MNLIKKEEKKPGTHAGTGMGTISEDYKVVKDRPLI